MALPRILTARDVMSAHVVTLQPDAKMHEAATLLMKKKLGGAPVVDPQGRPLGVLSELDCLRCFLADSFSRDARYFTATTADFMTREVIQVPTTLDVYGMAQKFVEHRVRRLVVVEEDCVVGIVTRRDLMNGVQAMREGLAPHEHYPDYPPDRAPLQDHHRGHWGSGLPGPVGQRRSRRR